MQKDKFNIEGTVTGRITSKSNIEEKEKYILNSREKEKLVRHGMNYKTGKNSFIKGLKDANI